ncbi:MAG: FHA domain-containing protein [Polyangiaceae bacterium]
MICDVCGHANADRLTFCQECGRRLKSREAPRVVAPTPPQGMPKVAVAPQAAAPAPAPAPAPVPAPAPIAGSAKGGRSRPESAPPGPLAPVAPAPAGKTKDSSENASAAPDASGGASLQCPTCGTPNPPMYRFCVTCGVTLPRDAGKSAPAVTDRPQAPPQPAAPAPQIVSSPHPVGPLPQVVAASPAVSTPQPASSPQPAPAPQPVAAAPTPSPVPVAAAPAPAPSAPHPSAPRPVVPAHVQAALQPLGGRLEERIVPAPVVDIAPGSAPAKPITCPRCQGQCIPTARFCQFCGAAFTSDARGSAPSAQPPRPADDEPRSPATVREHPLVSAARAATPQPRGRLVVIEADGSEGMTFTLHDRPVDIGRSEGDILVKEDPYVSPRHARLVPDGNRWIVRDLASTNGVYLRLKKAYLLQDADLLLLGQEVLQFQLVSEPEKGLGHASQHGTLLFGSPITSRSARLCQRTVEGIVRDVYHLHRDETIIGRETGDIVFTADPFLSRRHAMIRRALARKENAGRAGSRWDFTLTDLDSSNGTFVAIRNEVALQHGDFVRVGQHLFRVDFA